MKAKAVEYTLSAKRADFTRAEILSSLQAQAFARKFYHEDIEIYESVFIILLNQANTAVGYAKISQGGICASLVDYVIIAKYAIDVLAKGVVVVHNHPSGSLKPSPQDDNFTHGLKRALDLLSIRLQDSIILAPEDGKYYSYADNGKMY